MSKIKSWYNQNRKTVWIVILTIIAVITLIQTFNNYYKNKTKEESSSTNFGTTTSNKNYAIVTQEKINESTSKENNTIIKNFFDLCNEKSIEEAYNMLSTECKEELYPTINDFNEKYCKRIFTEQKIYEATLWISNSSRNTYRLEITGDLLATGQKDYIPIEDYYTIVNENGEYKLNINRLIGKDEINVTKSQSNINVTIVSKKIYMDYETYEIKVQNNTGSKLIFNTKENTDSVYLYDENGLKYIAFLNELVNNELEILNGTEKTFNIKFNRGYKVSTKIEKIIFEDIKINDNETTDKIEIEL